MQDYFYELAEALAELLRGDEVFTASFSAEASDFARFNRGFVRQAGSVSQRELCLDLIEGSRHAVGRLTLGGSLERDRARLAELMGALRDKRATLPEDPHLHYARELRSTEVRRPGRLPAPDALLAEVGAAARGHDLVGLYAAGHVYRGFANSLGQRNWYDHESFHFDWSLYADGERAVKAALAGQDWHPEALRERTAWAEQQLAALARPARAIEPGRYRVYLTPSALQELFDLLAWGGFGLRSHRSKDSPLLRMVEQEARLADGISLRENTAEGMAPNFEAAGFLRPDSVTLVERGRYSECLVSPRSAREFDAETNGAQPSEAPLSIDMAAGSLPRDRVLAELGTGIFVSNLWYLNYSDRPACRTTGMTRFATFWVENGALAAPLRPMRFDETIYRILGENLVALTSERETLLDPDTYERRSLRSARLPGALIDDFNFTL